MFAPQNQTPNVIDALSGNLSEWYNAVDEALRTSEIIPGEYEYTTATSYGNVGPINEGDTTYVDIFPDRFKIISLDNSYITLEQEVTIEVPNQTNLLFTEYYIGYKCSADAIDQYRIYSNTDKIQDVHNARYEWFMFYNSLSNEAKANSDCFATIEKIRNHNPMVPGVYVNLSKVVSEGKTITVTIPLRIPVSFFLLLFNMRYYPNWAGKLSIELMPSYRNIVIAPVVSEAYLFGEDIIGIDVKETIEDDYVCDLGFRNINESAKSNIVLMSTGDAPNKVYSCEVFDEEQTFKCNTQTTKSVKIKLATYMLKTEVFNALHARFITGPMLFPIHVVQIRDFTQELGSNNTTTPTTYDTAATIALKHCDTMFTVFRQSQHSNTCFLNPQISYSFNIDGKFYPREPYNTVNDSRHFNMLLDALNVNNSLLTSVSDEILTSTQPYYKLLESDASGVITEKKKWCGKDNSDFFIGLPFAEAEDFQGGITTSGTVQIELRGERLADTSMKDVRYISPVGIYFEDAVLKVWGLKPIGRPQIEITSATPEQIIAGLPKVAERHE